ncbi:hypothetical protein [Vulcanococcus sp.]|jgi:hypothetical protein|uniref:hypothetical protein n=1 Tax=Vulcanococcus sp. TaxID=2856995 RepID=UPI003C096535
MAYLLQFLGVTDPLRLFYLEQRGADGIGPAFTGFRPVCLDGLLSWALETAGCRHWDCALTEQAVMRAWMERAEAIHQWQQRLRCEPEDCRLVTGLGTQQDWEQRCEAMLAA